MDDKIFTIQEASNFLRLGRSRLYELLAEGQIRAVRIGRRTVIRSSDLQRFLQALPEYAAESPANNSK
jgi:excisionase family DNA binding protein